LLYFAGVDVLTAMKQMGHSDIKTTMQIYTHLDAAHQRKSMEKLDGFLEHANSMQTFDLNKR
jgi:integrase